MSLFDFYSHIFAFQSPFNDLLPASPPPTLLDAVDRLILLDSLGIYLTPVDLSGDMLEDYLSVVSHPMDLSIVRERALAAAAGELKYTAADARRDVNTIVNNCLAFNDDASVYATAARRLGRNAARILKGVGAASDASEAENVSQVRHKMILLRPFSCKLTFILQVDVIEAMMTAVERLDWDAIFLTPPDGGPAPTATQSSSLSLPLLRWRVTKQRYATLDALLDDLEKMFLPRVRFARRHFPAITSTFDKAASAVSASAASGGERFSREEARQAARMRAAIELIGAAAKNVFAFQDEEVEDDDDVEEDDDHKEEEEEDDEHEEVVVPALKRRGRPPKNAPISKQVTKGKAPAEPPRLLRSRK